MRNRFFVLICEAIGANVLAVFLIWKLFIETPEREAAGQADLDSVGTGMLLLALIYAAVMLLIAVQGYFYIVKPHSVKIKEMEAAAEESKKAEEIRREFVANVSHELKTPLTSISGFIETLQDGAAEDPEIRTRFIDIISIETSRLKRLIEDLLVLSDIENKRAFEDTPFSVKEAIESTVETLRPLAESKNIEMITELDDSISIVGSADRFRQMMVNFIENAIKYSDDGGHVWVKAYYGSGEIGSNGEDSGVNAAAGGGESGEAGDKIVVSVRDQGIGIAPEHHERLFERFYRVDKSRSKKAGGTGLGLSIVKHIAALFGATLKVESDVGKGATFYVIFNREEKGSAS